MKRKKENFEQNCQKVLLELNGGGYGMQALTDFFEGFHCCDLVLELVPVDHRSWEEGVSVDLSGGSLHGFYCLHFEGDSLSLHPPSDGQSCITKKTKNMESLLSRCLFCGKSHPRSSCMWVTQPGLLVV